MVVFFALLPLLPLLSVHALPQAPPYILDVHITNGQIVPTGTVSACSTITRTMGTLTDIIPVVSCGSDGAPLPATFTEVVDVDGTTASLVVEPTDVDFISESWLDQTTATPSSSSASGSASVSASSGPASSASAPGSAPASGHALSGSSSASGSSNSVLPPLGTGISSTITPSFGTGSSKTSLPLGTGTSSVVLGTGSSRSATPPFGTAGSSSSASSSVMPPLGTGTSRTVTPPLGTGISSSASSSVIPPLGIGTSRTVTPPLGTAGSSSSASSSIVPPIGTGTSSFSTVSSPSSTGPSSDSGSGSGSASGSGSSSSISLSSTLGSSQTASPASSTSGLPSSTSGGSSITSAPSGASSTSLFIPVTSPASTIPGVGPVASSSAKEIQTSLSTIIPIIQIYIKDPPCASCGADAINVLKGVLPKIKTLSDEIGPGPSSHPCDASPNLLADIFNAVKCVTQYVENAITHIQGGEPEIDELISDVTSLTDIQKPLEEDNPDNDENQSQTNSQDSQSSSQGSSTQTSSSASSSVSSSTSSSASSSASSTVSSSGSCLLPPEITLPPDSLMGGSQPDQPTSVVVTGLPSFDGSSGVSGSASVSATGSSSAAPSGSSSLPSITGPASTSSGTATPGSSVSSGASGSVTNSAVVSSSGAPASITSAPPKSTVAPNYCMTDGAPWFSPTSWCDCGPSTKYPLRSVSGASTGDCSYTTLPDSTIQPVSTSAAPTNIPGQGGLPGCRYVLYPNGQGCPYANYCDCGGTMAPLLTTTISGTSTNNCAYTIQPTENNCPTPTFTPTSTPPPPSSTPPPAPSPNVAIIIYREDSCGDIDAGCTSGGRIWDITPGEPVNPCKGGFVSGFDYSENVQNEDKNYNVVTEKFTSHDTFKNCQYLGTAMEVGTFSCDGFENPVQCIIPAAEAQDCSGGHSLAEDNFVPIAYCEWHQD